MAIRTALKDNNYCIVIFLDLKKVFDTFNHHILFGKLDKMGTNNPALNWFESYLEKRRQRTDIYTHYTELATIKICASRDNTWTSTLHLQH
jgi:hypothetical protein